MCQAITIYHLCGHLHTSTTVSCSETISKLLSSPNVPATCTNNERLSAKPCSEVLIDLMVLPMLCKECAELAVVSEWLGREAGRRFELIRAWKTRLREARRDFDYAVADGDNVDGRSEDEENVMHITHIVDDEDREAKSAPAISKVVLEAWLDSDSSKQTGSASGPVSDREPMESSLLSMGGTSVSSSSRVFPETPHIPKYDLRMAPIALAELDEEMNGLRRRVEAALKRVEKWRDERREQDEVEELTERGHPLGDVKNV